LALSLAESIKLIENPESVKISNVFVSEYVVASLLPVDLITGYSKTFTLIDTLPTVAPRPFGTDFSASTGSGTSYSVSWTNYGGIFTGDKALAKGNPTQASMNLLMQIQAVAKNWTADVFQGLGTSNAMKGLKYFVNNYYTGQIVNGSSTTSGGDLLTQAMLDDAIDMIDSPNPSNTGIFMSKIARKRLASLARTAGFAFPQTIDAFGNLVHTYAGLPVYIMEDAYTGADILSVVEPCGNGTPTNTTSSVWVVKFGPDNTVGFGPNGGALSSEVVNAGTSDLIYRCEVNTGILVLTPRSVSRIKFVKQAVA
jgi:hypothetical protein